MRIRGERRVQFIINILLCAIVILFIDLIIYSIIVHESQDVYKTSAGEIMNNMTGDKGKFSLSVEESVKLHSNNEFAFIIDKEGKTVWSENLPDDLKNRQYTLQDVAKFSRYYLEDYPVHTYVVDDGGLLIIGKLNSKIWKYTLEYDVNNLLLFVKITPLVLVVNIILLIFISLKLYKAKQRRREEERVEWIAGVSHDIRTPLAIILGNAQMILNESPDDRIKNKAEIIDKQGVRIRALVENLNLSSKLDFGTGRFIKKQVQMSIFIRKILTNIINTLDEDTVSKFEFDLNIEEGLQGKTFLINEELVERAIINLINNSMKYNEEGCTISINLNENNKNTVLEIKDNGQGVNREFLQKINKKSYAFEKSMGNRGLGLKIVKKVAEYHRWKIEFLKNEEGGFSCRMQW
jgi:hypothetical protein